MIRKICVVTILLFTVFLIKAAFCVSPENFRYESRGKRDPFVPLIGQDKPSIAKLEDITSIEDVNLEGIAIGAKGQRVVMINGEILKENNKVGEIEIKKIDRKAVTLLIGGKAHTIKLPEEGGLKGE